MHGELETNWFYRKKKNCLLWVNEEHPRLDFWDKPFGKGWFNDIKISGYFVSFLLSALHQVSSFNRIEVSISFSPIMC